MNKKIGILLLSLIVVVVLYISFTLVFSQNQFQEPPLLQDKSRLFEENPNQFFDLDFERQLTQDVKMIDVPQITDYQSEVFSSSQQYELTTGFTITFELTGAYRGIDFRNEFLLEDGRILMRITPQLQPNDGIIDGYIVQRIEDEDEHKIATYIFVDEDWKSQFPNTNIVWGANYQNTAEFQFYEMREGVYMTKIYDDPFRRSQDFGISQGGIVVGQLNQQDILTNNTNLTYMRLYG